MSSHLIQPIELYDWLDNESLGLQCIKHGNTTPKWRTVSTLLLPGESTSLYGSENDDKWSRLIESQFSDGGVKYATSCLKKATLRFYLPEVIADGVEARFVFDLYISPSQGGDRSNQIENGYVLAVVETGDPAQTVDYIVDLEALGIECSPCGHTWVIQFGFGSNDYSATLVGQMTLEIVDVTF
jgi:hypothetical protein